jgi:CTP:molybdopterin cytidylyltransferase MocA
MSNPPAHVAGIVLAAGAGTRFGRPKALASDPDGALWLPRAVRSLVGGGCAPVIVVLGAAADEAEALLRTVIDARQAGGSEASDAPVVIARAADWQSGMAASLRCGLAAAGALSPTPHAVAIVPVDVPSLGPAQVRRLIAPEPDAVGADTLRQATFSGRPGHPAVIGRAHWAALSEQLEGDVGARAYLQAHGVRLIDCSDLGSGLDVDEPNESLNREPTRAAP